MGIARLVTSKQPWTMDSRNAGYKLRFQVHSSGGASDRGPGSVADGPDGENWSELVKKIESDCTYDVTEDVERIKTAVAPEQLSFVLRTLNLDSRQPRQGEDSVEVAVEAQQHSECEGVGIVPPVEVIYALKEADLLDPSEEDMEFRQTVCQSVFSKICDKPIISPYKTELSLEDSISDLSSYSISSSSSTSQDGIPPSSSIEVQPPSPDLQPERRDILVDHRSPFQKFFSRTRSEIENHLDRHITKQVFSEKDKLFIDFMNFLDSPDIQLKSENITLDSLKSLFNIQIENPAAHAFTTDTAELSKIPKEISEIYDDVEASGRASLHRQIIWDMLYEEGAGRRLAFGRSLPEPRPRWHKDTKRRWLVSKDIPWDLVSGRDLWKDLLNTEILEGFGKWLVANPQYDRPKYLEKIGYFKSLPKENLQGSGVEGSLKKKRCGEAFYALANNMKYFVGDQEQDYLPRLEELKEVLESSNQIPGDVL